MQKLSQRNTYTPTDTSLVRSNCDLPLNKDENLSVVNLKTCDNNPEVNLLQRKGGLNVNVYVLDINGNPLMPCKPAKARKLLKSGNAKVIKNYPFVIQLNWECEGVTQDVILGIDSGYSNVGFSAISPTKELISGVLKLDNKTSERLTTKRMYRKLKRRKLWYRKPRFLNRKKEKGWLPPSIQRRYDTHLNLINKLKKILPISSITIETASFDIQKIENPEISGIEYQQGEMYHYANVRDYLFFREDGQCQLCHKQIEYGEKIHIHHCKEKNEGGPDRPSNLALLHKKCHVKLHKKGMKLSSPKQYKAETFMSIIHKRFQQDIPDVYITYGYITQIKRQELGLEKTHYNDAFVIANGITQKRYEPIVITQKHRNNRAIQLNRKGCKPAIRKQRYKIQPRDLVWVNGKKYTAKGTHGYGKYVRVEISKKNKDFSIGNIEKIYNSGSLIFT